MSVSSGFFNSLNGDRKYNAAQMSAIFDGLIIDGVFASIGTAFAVKAAGGLTVNVGVGKAWFDHTWTVNDSILPMTAPEAEVLLDRIDAVVLEVNGTESVRENTIKFVKGNPSSAPSRPTLTNEGNVHQYYAAFPYTSTGAYNRSEANRTSVTPKKRDYLFGYDLVKATSSPTGRVTYPSDVDNAAFTPAAMNFSTGKFSYGGWAFDPGEKFMPRPCMLTYAGAVDHYLNPDDYTKKVDGSASKVADTSFGGNAMMEWPKIYTKRWEENGVYHFRCSDIPQDDDWDCWCNYDRQNNQIDHFYTPIYFGSLVSGKLRSISGAANSVSTTAANEITYAKANGNDWYTEVLADRLLLQDLLVMMARSTECQTAFGYGRCKSSNSNAIAPGTMNTKGMFWGSNDQTSGVKVFGMENVWGNLWRRTAGWINANGTQKVKLTRGTHDGSTAADYNTDGSGYKTVANAKLAGIATGAQVNTIEKVKVNGTEVTPAEEDKSVALTIPTGALANKDTVAEADLDAALKEKVNAASEGNHSHANKAFLDTLSGATDEEVTAMCTEVFGA